jgi:serine/threonine-protein kinase
MDVPERERPTWLASLGSEYAAVRPWLARVITSADAAPAPKSIERPSINDADSPEFRAGQHIGPYTLQRRLGSGGMGEVWLASRSDGTLSRQVALKLPHAHLIAGVLRRRFERERDILAGLSHPNIAQLYDAGVADSQHPYLAMEWVDGIAINEHCRTGRLPLDQRLDLFLQVLEAVGHAHGRLIAHRDLKPSNILVARAAQVKLLDFGIAKLLADDTDGGATQLTRIGTCLATPAYAAPEQLAGKPITAAVDIYALGVILHELLTGQRPQRSKPADASAAGDAARASTQVDPAHAPLVGGLEPVQLRRALAGDLDAIIAKALEADPARRYRSAEAFAQDIELSRRHRPISARHLTPARLALKFMRRHRLGVAMSGGLALALIGGSAGIAWQAVRAEREAERATAIKDFLVGVFRASDPRIAADKPRGEITARELLDASAREIESGFAKQPQTQVELLGVTADIYNELDETKRSAALYQHETELAARYFGASSPHAIEGLLGQANDADEDGDDARALEILKSADPLIHQAHLDRSTTRARWLLIRGNALMDDAAHTDEAEQSLREAASLFQNTFPGGPYYWEALQNLGSLLLDRSQFAAAAGYYRQAIELARGNRALEGNLLLSNQGLAIALSRSGDPDGATNAFESGANIAARTYGLQSHQYWQIASDWALFRYERGERTAAFEAFDALLKDLPADKAGLRSGTDGYQAAAVLRKFGHCLALDGQGGRAIEELEAARELFKTSATRAKTTVVLSLDLGAAYEAGGRVDDARSAYLTALKLLADQNAPVPQLIGAHVRWARFLLAQQDFGRAESEFDFVRQLSKGRPTEAAAAATAGMAAIAVSHDDVRHALNFSAAAMQQLDHLEDPRDVRVAPFVWGIRARSLLLSGDADAALTLAKRVRDADLRYYSPDSPQVKEAENLVRIAYLSLGASRLPTQTPTTTPTTPAMTPTAKAIAKPTIIGPG